MSSLCELFNNLYQNIMYEVIDIIHFLKLKYSAICAEHLKTNSFGKSIIYTFNIIYM